MEGMMGRYECQGRQAHGQFGHGTCGAKPKPPQPGKSPATPTNIADLAQVLYNEAHGYGRLAMTAVGWTLRNRMIRNRVSQTDQAWVGYNHRHQEPARNAPGDQMAFKEAKEVATGILNGSISDPTHGATHYYSPQAMATLGLGDPKAGKESVRGVVDVNTGKPMQNGRPGYSLTFTQEHVEGIADRDFKFFRAPGSGPVR